MNEKPLHIRVAEAMGWTDFKPIGRIMSDPDRFEGTVPPPFIIGEHRKKVPLYDLDDSFCLKVLEANTYNVEYDDRDDVPTVHGICVSVFDKSLKVAILKTALGDAAEGVDIVWPTK